MALDFDEAVLIEEAKGGNEASFEKLIMGCKTKAYNTALRYLRNEDDAMDALQESLIKVFRHLDKFKKDSKFETWVYRIVVNTCKDILRKNRQNLYINNLNNANSDNGKDIELPDSSPGPTQQLEAKETTALILDCLDQISIQHKEVIILRDIQGFSYDEISEILGCSIGTVKSRINRARLKLRDKILEQSKNEFV